MSNKGIDSKIIQITLACFFILTLTSCSKEAGKHIAKFFAGVIDTTVEEVANCNIESRKEDCVLTVDKKNKNELKQYEKGDIDNSKFSPKNHSFYFLADTAFVKNENANNEIKKLKNLGYKQAGKFWLQDYPNLSNKPYYQVYAATFNNRTNCIEFLKSYIQRNQDAYCALASTNENALPDYFGSYSLKRKNP